MITSEFSIGIIKKTIFVTAVTVSGITKLYIIIKFSAFSTDTLKEILHAYRPEYIHDDLLALYTFTGGTPKYMDCSATTMYWDDFIHGAG